MASINKNIKVTTIEKDTVRYLEAGSNIQKYNLNKQIKIINKDATEVEINDKFDLIFIDASKGKNTFFFNKFKDNLNKNGTIITDNLSFHGLVEDESLIKTKNQRGIVNKIKDFKSFLDNNEEFNFKQALESVSYPDLIHWKKENLLTNWVSIRRKKLVG